MGLLETCCLEEIPYGIKNQICEDKYCPDGAVPLEPEERALSQDLISEEEPRSIVH